MADKAHLSGFYNRQPVFLLFISFLIVFFAGTLLLSFFIFAGSFLFRTGFQELLTVPPPDAGEKAQMILRYVLSCQQLSLFIVPAVIIAIILKKEENFRLDLKTSPGRLAFLLVIILAFLLFPITIYTGSINSKMHFPVWLSGLESWMRGKEQTASDVTDILIRSDDIKTLSINIIVLAILPALGEELLFRGILQQILIRIFRSYHTGIWLTALLFSALHFQFYGFIPRLILGLIFGYLFYWSSNLWLPVLAHFINNVVPVILSFLVGWKKLNSMTVNVAGEGLIIPLLPALLCVFILYYFRSEHNKKLIEFTKRQEEQFK
jgi:membrane protease YdiL (CAAX protease family)